MTDFKGEKLESDLKTKEVFYYYDDLKKIRQISREVFKNKDEIVHYPRGIDQEKKYQNIERIRIIGFKGKIPVGLIKSVNLGYGFTKTLGRFAFHVDDEFGIKEVVIEKTGSVELNKVDKKLLLSEKVLLALHKSFKAIYDRHRVEVRNQISQHLYGLFKSKVPKPKISYISGTLASSLATWGNSITEFSIADKEAIKDLFDKLSMTTDFLTEDALAKTKELVDSKYIQNALAQFRLLMSLTTDGSSLEKRWQSFLKSNSWIFSSIFAQPVILHKDEAYVGGKSIQNKDGKVSDFLMKNKLSDNVSFLEIKTHKTKLLESLAYRGSDVFSATKDLSGCVSQVLNQRDNFQKEFYAFKGKSSEVFETLNSRCVVLIGSIKDLNKEQKQCFELFRSNSRDVEVLTFDELQKKIEALQKLIKTS